MKRILWLTAVIAVALGGTSCASGKKTPAVPQVELHKFSAESEKSSFDAASRFASGFAAAVETGDFAAWHKEMPPHIRNRINAEKFGKMRGELQELFGKMTGFRHLGTLRKGDLRDYLWVMSFDKDGKVNEVVYLVRVFCAGNGLPEISGFGVRRF